MSNLSSNFLQADLSKTECTHLQVWENQFWDISETTYGHGLHNCSVLSLSLGLNIQEMLFGIELGFISLNVIRWLIGSIHEVAANVVCFFWLYHLLYIKSTKVSLPWETRRILLLNWKYPIQMWFIWGLVFLLRE